MAEVDRRRFLRLLRRSDEEEAEEAPDSAPAPELDPEAQSLADFTSRLLADLDAEEEELLAEGVLLNSAYDLAYMRVTSGHIVFSASTGMSGFMKTSDVVALETTPEIQNDRGHGARVPAVIRVHHPADPPAVTRTHGFRFPPDSPLVAAIRAACDLPEPEPEPEGEEEEANAGAAENGGAGPAEETAAERSDADPA